MSAVRGVSNRAPRGRPPGTVALGVLLLILGVPSLVHANMGTPLMWATLLHLALGNLVIGLGEGFLLARLARLPAVWSMGLLVLANYVSSWAAFLLLPLLSSPARELSVVQLLTWGPWALLFVTWLGSVVTEWPFCWLAGWRTNRPRWWLRSLLLCAVLQVASYALLVPWYASVSHWGRGLKAGPEPTESARGLTAWVYYIARDGRLERVRFDGTGREPTERSVPAGAYLDGRSARTDEPALVLICRGERTADVRPCESGASVAEGNVVTDWRIGGCRHWREMTDLRPPRSSAWNVVSSVYSSAGLLIAREGDVSSRYSTGFATPWLHARSSDATVVPRDLVVFEWGGREIVVLDMAARRLWPIAWGRDPVVVWTGPGAEDPLTTCVH